MSKWEARKALKQFYLPPRDDFVLVEIPPFAYYMIDGGGGPASAVYREAIEALYAASYTLKFTSKEAGRDYVVPPLEALWWAEDMSDFVTRKKSNWLWTAMMLIPPIVAGGMAEQAIAAARGKKDLPGLARIRVQQLHEGLCAQILHIGSYDDEGPTLQRLHHEILPARGLAESGHHHEIYLNDPRRTAPERLRTVLRQPVVPLVAEPAP